MRILVAAVGRLKDEGESELFARYVKRLQPFARSHAIGPVELVELPESRAATSPLRQADESSRLLKAAAKCDVIVALDEIGASLTSEKFAAWLAQQRDGGAGTIGFVLGGADGHGAAVTSAAKLKLSLGAMTLPHGLARVILAEQLYRAATILAGHPYHRS